MLAGFAASALLLSTNWGIYIWAVNNGRVVDASLGYFINPLVNVRARLAAAAGASAAAAMDARSRWRRPAWPGSRGTTGQPPWVALRLAGTFGATGCCARPRCWARWKGCRSKP